MHTGCPDFEIQDVLANFEVKFEKKVNSTIKNDFRSMLEIWQAQEILEKSTISHEKGELAWQIEDSMLTEGHYGTWSVSVTYDQALSVTFDLLIASRCHLDLDPKGSKSDSVYIWPLENQKLA